MKALFSLFFIITALACQAQAVTDYTFYKWQTPVFNSAAVGIQNGISGGLRNRIPYHSFKELRTASTLYANTPILYNQMGIGVNVNNISNSFGSINTAKIQLSYKIKALGGILSYGMGFGIFHEKIDFEKFNQKVVDPELVSLSNQMTVPDVDAGLFLTTSTYFISLSVQHLIPINSNSYFRDPINPEVHLMGNYILPLSENITFQPGGVFSYGNKTSLIDKTKNYYYDANLSFEWKDMLTVGTSFNYTERLAFLALFDIQKALSRDLSSITIGYSYDHHLGATQGLSRSSHEVALNFRFEPRPDPDVIKEKKIEVSPNILY
jgi:type IX secretion system PorP/SprF family membrane protein